MSSLEEKTKSLGIDFSFNIVVQCDQIIDCLA